MNVLVTGANGFIGKELVECLLNRGDNVFALVNNKNDMSYLKCKNLKVIELLFDDYKKIAAIVKSNIDIAYHLAWDGLYGEQAADVSKQLRNVLITEIFLNEAKKLNTKKIVFASSMNILEVIDSLKYPLDYQTRGMYIHAASKLNAEIVARVFCEKNKIAFNNAIIAMVYGENNKSRMITNVFIENLLNGVSPLLVKGDNDYDIIYVKDVASAFVAIGLNGIDKKRYYIGHNWNRTFKDIFTEIGQIVNPNIKLIFGTYDGDNHVCFKGVNKGELTKDTGWAPMHDFEESIKNTTEWIKNGGLLCK